MSIISKWLVVLLSLSPLGYVCVDRATTAAQRESSPQQADPDEFAWLPKRVYLRLSRQAVPVTSPPPADAIAPQDVPSQAAAWDDEFFAED